MKARDAPADAPQIASLADFGRSSVFGQTDDFDPSTDTGIRKPAKVRRKKPRPPKERRRSRPPKVTGYTWRKDGAGWQLRKAVYDVTDTGIRKRRLPYVAHLSKSAFAEMKRQHRGAALDRAIAAWIEDHDR